MSQEALPYHHKHANMKPCILILLIIVLSSSSCKDASTPKASQAKEPTTQKVTNTPSTASATTSKKRTLLFFGDSLTAGYGLDEEESFPSLIQNRIDSLGRPYEVINAGLSGETSAGGKGRIDWVLNKPVDIFVLELGANDMLRGLDINETEKNLRAILDVVKVKSPDTQLVIAGMEAPPNMGEQYTSKFRGIFSSIAKEYNAALIPFLLEGVAGIPELNLGDGKHPNPKGQQIVTENVWRIIDSYVKEV